MNFLRDKTYFVEPNFSKSELCYTGSCLTACSIYDKSKKQNKIIKKNYAYATRKALDLPLYRKFLSYSQNVQPSTHVDLRRTLRTIGVNYFLLYGNDIFVFSPPQGVRFKVSLFQITFVTILDNDAQIFITKSRMSLYICRRKHQTIFITGS